MSGAALNESIPVIKYDRDYRRMGKHIVIAQIESVVPLRTATFEPRIWGGGYADYTWGEVQQFFSHHPVSRNGLPPMHYYCEYLDDDYAVLVGCPLSNRSWFLQAAIAAGVIPPEYGDAILIVLQENYGIENVEKRLWRVLANTTITPLMRLDGIPRSRVVFFEKLANREAVVGPDWDFRWREPQFLDPLILDFLLKDYEKR